MIVNGNDGVVGCPDSGFEVMYGAIADQDITKLYGLKFPEEMTQEREEL